MIMIHFLLFLFSTPLFSASLSDHQPFEYSVLFTNPVCGPYRYEQEVFSNDGQLLRQKPLDVYCKKADREVSAERPSSPEYKILQWLRNPQIHSVFFAFLSFSNKIVAEELCQQVESRGLNVTIVLDSRTDRDLAETLSRCQALPEGPGRAPEILYRGNTSTEGRGRVGLQHNKFMLYLGDGEEMGLAFGSANLSSGTVLHHENWHFIRTNKDSYFAQSHLCLKDGLLGHAQDKTSFRNFMANCRANIIATAESDLQSFFVPAEGHAASTKVFQQLADADELFLAAHRLSWAALMKSLHKRLEEKTLSLKIVVDDDIYWSGKLGRGIGANTVDEARRLQVLIDAGAEVRYMQTNQKEFLFHHNKFMLMKKDGKEFGLFAGAGNFTTTAFTDNFENFYWISMPAVLTSFDQQSEHLWQLATAQATMPQQMILP